MKFQVVVGTTPFAMEDAIVYISNLNERAEIAFDVPVPAAAWSASPTPTNIKLQWQCSGGSTTMNTDAGSNFVITIIG